MVLDVVELPEEPSDELTLDLDHSKPRGLGRFHISHLLQMVLQDAQTRLFFKAQSLIQAEIRYYAPKPEDLAYPNILVGLLFKTSWFRASGSAHETYCSCKKAYFSV